MPAPIQIPTPSEHAKARRESHCVFGNRANHAAASKSGVTGRRNIGGFAESYPTAAARFDAANRHCAAADLIPPAYSKPLCRSK
jgi:hypothetical protein